MTGSVNTSKTKGQSRLQRRAVENTLWTQLLTINSYQLGYWGKGKTAFLFTAKRCEIVLFLDVIFWQRWYTRWNSGNWCLFKRKKPKHLLVGRNSGVWLGWHVVLLQRTDPWHYQCENNEPLDFVLSAFTWVLASVRVAYVRSPVSDSSGCLFNFSLEVCMGRDVDGRASGEYSGCSIVSQMDWGWIFKGLP